MPRILRILNRFNLGGPTYNAAYLSKFMPSDYQTRLIGGVKEDDEDSSEYILNDLGVEYELIPEMRRSLNPLQDYKAYKRIRSVIREFKPDIVHTHAAKAGALGRMAAIAEDVKIIVHTFHGHVFHSYFGAVSTSFYKMIERRLARKTHAIVAISDQQKRELCEIHRIALPEKVHVIPLGFDLSRFALDKEARRIAFRQKYSLADDTIAIGIVGRLVPVKNHDLFLKSLSYLKSNGLNNFKAFIVGDGAEKPRLIQMAENLGVADQVIFTSWIRDVEKLYPGLDLVALTSFNEGTPVSLIEAQAAGVPVISTKVGGIENAVIADKTGCLVDLEDEITFFNKFKDLALNAQERAKMSLNGPDFVYNNFSFKSLVDRTDKLYRTLLR